MKKSSNLFKSFFWVLAAFVLAVGAVLAGRYVEKNTRIEAVEFSGNHFTPEEELFASLDSPIGLLADSVDYPSLLSRLDELPYVKQSGVNMSIMGTLTFVIREREPLAMLIYGSERVYVSEGGHILPVLPGKAVDVPLLYGFAVNSDMEVLTDENFEQVERFLTAIRSSQFGWISISEITWNSVAGVVAVGYKDDVKLIFGKDDFEEKLQKWDAFYSEVVPMKGFERFESIDFRFKNQIITKDA